MAAAAAKAAFGWQEPLIPSMQQVVVYPSPFPSPAYPTEWHRSEWFAEDYYSRSPKKNPKGPDKGEYRVLRGGSWDNDAWYCRAAVRGWGLPGDQYNPVGFRLCVSRQNSE